MNRFRYGAGISGLVLTLLLAACGAGDDEEVPPAWRKLVKTEGQHYPIPEAWLSTPEGKIAHSLKLPDSVPKPVPFDFDKADGPWYWPASKREVAIAYFRHLCKTEAGEWTFKKVGKVDGLYFARPEGDISDQFLGDVYGPEAPWIEREFQWFGESVQSRGQKFVNPPFSMFSYVEEPKREVKWQKDIRQPYIRMFGYTTARFVKPGQVVVALNELTPMQLVGLDKPSARYSYTWRGITRPKDRQFKIAGGELIIYDRESQEIVSVSRSFQITGSNSRAPYYRATWLVSPVCAEGIDARDLFINKYAQRVLLNKE